MISFVVGALAFQSPLMARTSSISAVSPVDTRVTTPQMGATIRELRDRVGSVKNTKKITSAMKLVAAAKVRRAQEAVLRSRPFSETLERVLGGLLERVKTDGLDIPLLETRAVNKIGTFRLCLARVCARRPAGGPHAWWLGRGSPGEVRTSVCARILCRTAPTAVEPCIRA